MLFGIVEGKLMVNTRLSWANIREGGRGGGAERGGPPYSVKYVDSALATQHQA